MTAEIILRRPEAKAQGLIPLATLINRLGITKERLIEMSTSWPDIEFIRAKSAQNSKLVVTYTEAVNFTKIERRINALLVGNMQQFFPTQEELGQYYSQKAENAQQSQ